MGQTLTRLDSLTEGGYTINVVTGDRRGAGTDANVFLIMHDECGNKSDRIKLNRFFADDHERGQTCSFSANPVLGFGSPAKIEIWRDKFGLGHAWLAERIEILESFSGEKYIFPIHRWIPPNEHIFISLYDCVLPHNDPHQKQRKMQLAEKRKTYKYTQHIKDGPPQIENIPEDEQFSGDYKWDIVTLKGTLIAQTAFIHLTTGCFETLDDLKKVYKYSMGEPYCLQYWTEDLWFGLQRVQGNNPYLISLCKAIPEKLGVTSDMVEPFLEGLTLDEALRNKKIFIVDLHVLEDVECMCNRKICAPIGLFYQNKKDELLPIAIQLEQNKGPNAPVFLPSDPCYTWLTAKMFFNNADASYHQSIAHLCFTHLIMESVTICTHRNLSPSHPVFRLLAPHFLFLIAINTRGINKLISPGGWVDKTMTIGVKGMFEIIARGKKHWRLDVFGNPGKEIQKRGVLDPDILKYYPYRDDSIRLHHYIKKYVTKIINYYYPTPEKIANDEELQAWRVELTLDTENQGCGVQGIAGEELNKFSTAEEVIDVVTGIIFTCSVSHAACNFQQYDQYAFPPNYPGILVGDPPTSKKDVTEAEFVKYFPDKKTTLDIMIITKLLSTKGTNSLGDFEVQFLYDPYAVTAADDLRKELKELSYQIKKRNYTLSHAYPYLDPDTVPNSISI